MYFLSVDLGASVTVSSSIEVDTVVHTLRDKKIKDKEISFATSSQDFELSHENNGKFYRVVAKVGIHVDTSLKPFYIYTETEPKTKPNCIVLFSADLSHMYICKPTESAKEI